MALSGPLNTPFDVDIALDSNPEGNATVRLFPASPAGLTLSPTVLSFDETDWSTPKQVSATLKQNPIELGGQQNTQVVLTETTTSWGGAWNITKDTFRLTVEDEPEAIPNKFAQQLSIVGSGSYWQYIGYIEVPASNTENLDVSLVVETAATAGGVAYTGNIDFIWVHFDSADGSDTSSSSLAANIVGWTRTSTFSPGQKRALYMRAPGVGTVVTPSSGTYSEAFSSTIKARSSFPSSGVIEETLITLDSTVRLEATTWNLNTDPDLLVEIPYDPINLSNVTFVASAPASWQKNGIKHAGPFSGTFTATYCSISWTCSEGVLNASGVVDTDWGAGSQRSVSSSGTAARFVLEELGPNFPSGSSDIVFTLGATVTLKRI